MSAAPGNAARIVGPVPQSRRREICARLQKVIVGLFGVLPRCMHGVGHELLFEGTKATVAGWWPWCVQ